MQDLVLSLSQLILSLPDWPATSASSVASTGDAHDFRPKTWRKNEKPASPRGPLVRFHGFHIPFLYPYPAWSTNIQTLRH